MASQLNKALQFLSIEEEEEPCVLPDRPEFYATERNELSLVGRLLNPKVQRMADLILDIPRKWQLYDRVRGVALSQERFQFIFKYEHDLLAIVKRGPHTFKDWSIVLERWMEKPPEDYLQYLMVWVQMRNIPVNHYTKGTIEYLGEFAGHVEEVAFDPEKAQTKDYVRVWVKFDVSKPLRRAKKLTLPGGEVVNIRYEYERIQKRCYTCQRLTHDQERCPFVRTQKGVGEKSVGSSAESKNAEALEGLDESDPLFGVIPQTHLGMDPISGRSKIAKEVLQGMRQYLLAAEGPEKMAREDRVINSLQALENDPLGQKTFLRLEPAPMVSTDLDKGKGVVFDFSERMDTTQRPEKLMVSAISAGARILQSWKVLSIPTTADEKRTGVPSLVTRILNSGKVISESSSPPEAVGSTQSSFLPEGSTGYSVGFFESSTSWTTIKKPRIRRRPGTFKRKNNGKGIARNQATVWKKIGDSVVSENKRKAHEDVEPSKSSARFKKPLVVPNEGPSNI
ncbi:uncharacterized protein LOC108835952 [Raphanus sativus]|uniref:Uncharacterized protein LOC108835952 n=1 Tax=Raphanus sativus TaxID=3726 RepID=A0A6J0LZ59_RAPSA|nr:uncharacterized protein LOC108835952 [Raphanus sativus]